jgi:AcrR family transcriptional regulator
MDKEEKIRRRGDELLESIFVITKELIEEVGYPNITFQQIAKRARTSRAVLYRRWATTFDLIVEMINYKRKALGGNLIDRITNTGSLRNDLIQLLTLHNSILSEIGMEIFTAYFFEMAMNKKEILEETNTNVLSHNVQIMNKILEFAKSRGEKINEVDTEKLVDEVLLPVYKYDYKVGMK